MRNPVKISFFTFIFIFHTDSFNNNTDIFYTIIIIFPANFRYFSEAAVTTLFLFLLFIYFHMLRGIQNNFLFHFHIYTHFYWYYCSYLLFFLLKTQNFLKYPILLVFDMNKKTKQNKNFSNDWLENIIIIIKHHSSSWRSLCVFVTF